MKHLVLFENHADLSEDQSFEDWCVEVNLPEEYHSMQIWMDIQRVAKGKKPISNAYQEYVMRDKPKRTVDIYNFTEADIKSFVESGYEGDDEERITDSTTAMYRTLMTIRNSPGERIVLYRFLDLKNKNALDMNELGVHYVPTPDAPEGVPIGGKTYMITVETDKRDIDVEMTVWTNARHPQEEEITMNQSASTKVLKIERCE